MKEKNLKKTSNCPAKGTLLGYINSDGGKKEVILIDNDRSNHFYMIGQSGTGKSSMILQQAISDIHRGFGICVIDTYGDLSEKILQYYPKERIDDLIYFDLGNTTYPVGFNPLDGAQSDTDKDLLVNNIVNMFIDIYGNDLFGPRIQDYFRNACFLLSEQKRTGTFLEIIRLFSEESFTQSRIGSIKNPVVKNRWNKIFPKIGDREKQEIIPFIQAKLSPFTTSKYINKVIGQYKSSFSFEEVMKEKKVVICKFPKGIVGETNVTIMGRLILMQLKQAILKRINITEKERSPFFIYMDDFNQYLPNNFGEFLIDAKKYNVGVTMSNQYIDQLKSINNDLSRVILNNVGTILAFRVGNLDAEYLERSFSPEFSSNDLKNLGKSTGIIKVSSNGIQGKPFVIKTDLNMDKNLLNQKKKIDIIKKISALHRGTKGELVDKELHLILEI